MNKEYKVPSLLPKEIVEEICKPKLKINDSLVRNFYDHLIKISKVDPLILKYEDLDKIKIKELKKRIIKWRMLHYCQVLDNALIKGHDLIMTNNQEIKLNVFSDFYKNIRIYDSVTNEEISNFLQPTFTDKNDIYTYVYCPWCIEAFQKINESVIEFKNFLKGDVSVTLRFSSLGNEEIYGYFYDETNNKELHPLRQLSSLTKPITGLECDPRTKALSWYKEYFCIQKLEIIVEDMQYFIYKDTKKKIPDHLQPFYKYSKKYGDLYICVVPKYMDDPRFYALNDYNKKLNSNKILSDMDSLMNLESKNKFTRSDRNNSFKRRRPPRSDKKVYKCDSP
jgi:hypothetical protein